MAKHDMARVFIDRNGDGPTVIRKLNAIARELGHPTGRPDTSEGYSIWVTVETFEQWKGAGPKKQPKKAAKKTAPKPVPEPAPEPETVVDDPGEA